MRKPRHGWVWGLGCQRLGPTPVVVPGFPELVDTGEERTLFSSLRRRLGWLVRR